MKRKLAHSTDEGTLGNMQSLEENNENANCFFVVLRDCNGLNNNNNKTIYLKLQESGRGRGWPIYNE